MRSKLRMNSRKRVHCKYGYTLKKGYKRKFKSATRREGFTRVRDGKKIAVYPSEKPSYVKPTCIRDKKIPTIGPLRKGELIKHGYQYRLPSEKRHAALKSAVAEFGALSTFRKLDAVAKLSVHKASSAAKVFAEDRDWVKSHYQLSA